LGGAITAGIPKPKGRRISTEGPVNAVAAKPAPATPARRKKLRRDILLLLLSILILLYSTMLLLDFTAVTLAASFEKTN
jgi:hypothetical protein